MLVVGAAGAVQTQSFTGTYSGTGSGYASGKKAAGVGTMSGRARVIGRSTLRGSGLGTFTSSECLRFSGNATIRGSRGSLRLAMHGGQACASDSAADTVSFHGTARVVGGSKKFAGAGGALRFTGMYTRSTRAVTISFRGRLTY